MIPQSRPFSENRRIRGFTLIELLVVIAIIAILASMLFPVFARARENARRSSCASNLKQTGLSLMQYSQDYDERLPLASIGAAGGWTTAPPGGWWTGGRYYWQQLAYAYHKNTQIFYCPSMGGTPSTSTAGFAAQSGDKGHYGANNRIFPLGETSGIGLTNPTVAGTGIGFPIAAFVSPSSTYQIMDWGYFSAGTSESFTGVALTQYMPGAGDAGGTCQAAIGTSAANASSEPFYRDCVSGRHLGGINMLFADGHVKWLKANTVAKEGRDFGTNSQKSNHSKPNGFDPLAPSA
jgi:prepilin-type N-terminal cleavage/methylation domain-containing protein/prepilin-type processing-associated H-X9-DG protein